MIRRPSDLYGQIVSAGVEARDSSGALRGRVLRASLEVLTRDAPTRDVRKRGPGWWVTVARLTEKLPRLSIRGKLAAAVTILIVAGVLSWPDRLADDAWWAGPPAAWAQEVVAALEQVHGVTCRAQTVFVLSDGTQHTSSTSGVLYVGHDRYRRDIHDNGALREIQWYTPDGDGMVQISVRFDSRSYSVLRHAGSFGEHDPVERVRLWVRFADRAERQLDLEVIEGRECVGFELKASVYGDNPESWLDRVWIDVETKLPVCVELERPGGGEGIEKRIQIQDRFDFAPQLPADTFTPEIPSDFHESHPDGEPTVP